MGVNLRPHQDRHVRHLGGDRRRVRLADRRQDRRRSTRTRSRSSTRSSTSWRCSSAAWPRSPGRSSARSRTSSPTTTSRSTRRPGTGCPASWRRADRQLPARCARDRLRLRRPVGLVGLFHRIGRKIVHGRARDRIRRPTATTSEHAHRQPSLAKPTDNRRHRCMKGRMTMNRRRRRPVLRSPRPSDVLLLVSCGSDDDGDRRHDRGDHDGGSRYTTPADARTTTADTDRETDRPTRDDRGDRHHRGTPKPARPAGWTVDTVDCADPERPPSTDRGRRIKIGSAQPLSGTPAAAFAPVKDGFQLYLDYANAQGLLARLHDQRRHPRRPVRRHPDPGVVDALDRRRRRHLFSGIIGSPNNLAVRDTLNEECIPQLLALTGSPAWGDIDRTTRGPPARSCPTTSRPRSTPRSSTS